ncbi:MAG: ABC transporter permease [Chloroflexi bacterium]|nr:ABC transporter permease [Chloroflexota bacterium]
MGQYILKRLVLAVPTLLGVTLITFAILRLIPGDPVRLMLGTDATPESIAQTRQDLGLDQPWPIQYARWLEGILQGNLGRSIMTRERIGNLLGERFKATALLTATSLVISTVVGVSAGIVASLRPYRLPDKVTMVFALVGISMPSFWLGILLILAFSLWLRWLPPAGMQPPAGGTFADVPRYLILPAVTLAMRSVGLVARLTRATMLEVLSQDFVRTARAKGLQERAVVIRHAFRNAMIPVVTVVGLQLGTLLGGAVLVETVFAWPGLGTLTVSAILNRDYPTVQASLLLIAGIFVLANLLVDLSYGLIDPRVRYSK